MAQKKTAARKTMAQRTAKKAASPGSSTPSGGKKVTPKDKKTTSELREKLNQAERQLVQTDVALAQAQARHNEAMGALLQLDQELQTKIRGMVDKYELDAENRTWNYNYEKGIFTDVTEKKPAPPKE